jgi:hypothetical protein
MLVLTNISLHYGLACNDAAPLEWGCSVAEYPEAIIPGGPVLEAILSSVRRYGKVPTEV